MTGYAGEPHITSADDGAVNAAIYGASKYVLNTGQKFAYELISNNLIKIKDGYAMNQGRKIGQAVNDYEELTIDNGLQGVKRSDIIAIRYSKNIDTGIESAEFVVIKGTSGDTYKDPALETGNIIQGDSVDDFPLYRVKIEGLTITAVEPMFDVLVSMEELQNQYNDILGSQDISKIGDGTVTGAIDSLNSNLTDLFFRKALYITWLQPSTKSSSFTKDIPQYDGYSLVSVNVRVTSQNVRLDNFIWNKSNKYNVNGVVTARVSGAECSIYADCLYVKTRFYSEDES